MPLQEKQVSAVIPTRGDVDCGGIVAHLKTYPEIKEVVVITGTTPFNRYLAAEQAQTDVIYTQDDDCITDIRPLLDSYHDGFLCNAMTPEHAREYAGAQTLLGFGALFHRRFLRVLDGWKRDALFYREADRVFATLVPHKTVFPCIKILPHAEADNRMFRQRGHMAARQAIDLRILQQTGIRAH